MTLAKLYIHSLRNSVSVSSPQSLSAIRHLTREKKRLVLLSVLPRSQSQKTGKAHALPRGPGEREGTQTTHLASLGDSGTTQVDPIRPIVLIVLIVLAPLALLRRWGGSTAASVASPASLWLQVVHIFVFNNQKFPAFPLFLGGFGGVTVPPSFDSGSLRREPVRGPDFAPFGVSIFFIWVDTANPRNQHTNTPTHQSPNVLGSWSPALAVAFIGLSLMGSSFVVCHRQMVKTGFRSMSRCGKTLTTNFFLFLALVDHFLTPWAPGW